MGTLRPEATVAVVADHELVVAGLQTLLAGEAAVVSLTWPDFTQADRGSHDLVLVDPEHAEPQGLRMADLRGASLGRVVVFTWSPTREAAATAIADGAAGYLSKWSPADQLVGALKRIRAGEQVVTLTGPDDADAGSWLGRDAGLSRRESEIVAMITQGLSNLEIADRAGLSINSVKSYIRSAYAKMPATTRAQAVRWAMEHGFGSDMPTPDRVRAG